MGILDGPNNRILKADTKVQEALEALADHVDHLRRIPSLKLIGKTYAEANPKELATVKVDGVVFGYRLEDHQVFMRRVVFVKVPGYKIDINDISKGDLSEDELSRIMVALFNTILLPGNKPPEMKQIAPDCVLFTHDFIPEIAVERKPGLVSIAGGFGGKGNA